MLCVFVSLSILNLLADVYETLYNLYGIGGHSNAVLINLLQCVMVTWQARELMRWEWQLTTRTIIGS
jgi:hypothetical protein